MTPRRRVVDKVVISLVGSARRAALAARPEIADFRVFDAYDTRSGAGHPQFDEATFARRYGRRPRGGEVGVTISHLQVLQEFIAQDGPEQDVIVVAEDDAVPSPDLDRVLDRILRRVRRLDLVLLGELGTGTRAVGPGPLAHGPSSSWVQVSLLAVPVGPASAPFSHRVGHFTGMGWGTGLYAMTRAADRRYVDLVARERADWVADDFIRWAPWARIDVLTVTPRLATFEGSSTIDRAPTTPRRDGRDGVAARVIETARRHGAIARRVAQVTVRDARGREFPYLDGRYG